MGRWGISLPLPLGSFDAVGPVAKLALFVPPTPDLLAARHRLGSFGAMGRSDTSTGDFAARRRSLPSPANWVCLYHQPRWRHGPLAGPDPAPFAGNWLCFARLFLRPVCRNS